MVSASSEVEETVGIFEGLEADGEAKESILSQAKRRLEPRPVQIRSDIEIRSGHLLDAQTRASTPSSKRCPKEKQKVFTSFLIG